MYFFLPFLTSVFIFSFFSRFLSSKIFLSSDNKKKRQAYCSKILAFSPPCAIEVLLLFFLLLLSRRALFLYFASPSLFISPFPESKKKQSSFLSLLLPTKKSARSEKIPSDQTRITEKQNTVHSKWFWQLFIINIMRIWQIFFRFYKKFFVFCKKKIIWFY